MSNANIEKNQYSDIEIDFAEDILENDFQNSGVPTATATASFENYISQKELELKKQIGGNNNSKNSETEYEYIVQKNEGHLGHKILTFALVLSLIGLGYIGYTNYQESQDKVSMFDNQPRVAGVNADEEENFTFQRSSTINNVVTGANFSIVSSFSIPVGFEKKEVKSGFEYLGIEEKVATTTSFLFSGVYGGERLKSGVVVSSVEYDNRLNQSDFDQKVLNFLGDEWQIVGLGVEMPNGIRATKIDKKNNDEKKVYYVVVTSKNYYVVEIFNQAEDVLEFASITRFTDGIIGNLYLN